MTYLEKLPGQEREVNQWQNVVYQLVEKYLNTGRTIAVGNFFSTLDVAQRLMTLVFFYKGEVTLCVQKKNKAVILLSAEHRSGDVDTSEKMKPVVILDYNANKSGVDTMDQMLGTHSRKLSTNRWPFAILYIYI